MALMLGTIVAVSISVYKSVGGSMKGTIRLETERLVLRRFEAGDAGVLYREFGANGKMSRYSGWNPYATPEMAANTVREYLESYDDQPFYSWAIEQDGELVGTIGAYDFDAGQNSIEIGLSIVESCWGKGYASEALVAALCHLVGTEGIALIKGWCASDNVGSRRVMEKCGMTLSNTEKGALVVGDETFDRLDFVYRRQ